MTSEQPVPTVGKLGGGIRYGEIFKTDKFTARMLESLLRICRLGVPLLARHRCKSVGLGRSSGKIGGKGQRLIHIFDPAAASWC